MWYAAAPDFLSESPISSGSNPFLKESHVMIGIIVAGHGNFASEIISIAENIMGEQKYLEAVSVKVGEGEYTLRNELDAVLKVMEVDEVLILSDIFMMVTFSSPTPFSLPRPPPPASTRTSPVAAGSSC